MEKNSSISAHTETCAAPPSIVLQRVAVDGTANIVGGCESSELCGDEFRVHFKFGEVCAKSGEA